MGSIMRASGCLYKYAHTYIVISHEPKMMYFLDMRIFTASCNVMSVSCKEAAFSEVS